MRKRYVGAIILLPCLVLVVSLVIAACGGGSGPEGLPKRQLPESATPEKIMLEGLNATDGATSLHFIFDYSVVVPPTAQQTFTSEIKIEGEGDYDAKSGNAIGEMNWSSFQTEFSWVLFGEKSYFKVQDSDSWYELPTGAQWSIPSVSEITRNTAEYMENFEKISRLEDEVVNNRNCYHIALVPNIDAIISNEQFLNTIKGEAEQSNEETLKNLEELKQELKNANITYDYWIDKEYLVLRRIIANVEMVEKGDAQNPSYTAKVITEMDFPNYNIKVTVAPPETSMMYKGSSQ